jgi:hypothetical protein
MCDTVSLFLRRNWLCLCNKMPVTLMLQFNRKLLTLSTVQA